MTRYQAHREAHSRWATFGTAPGDRVASVTIRRKTVVDRFEVGYYVRAKPGMPVAVVIVGKGPSWEEAFARADRAEGKSS